LCLIWPPRDQRADSPPLRGALRAADRAARVGHGVGGPNRQGTDRARLPGPCTTGVVDALGAVRRLLR